MTEYVQTILSPLVDHPDAIRMTKIDGEKSIIIELRCHNQDLGKVIGKNGKTIQAVRALVSTLAAREGRRATLEVVE